MRILATIVFGVILGVATCRGVGQNRVLALLENLAIKETHSIYFRSLVDSGFTVTYKVADDSSLQLKKYGEYLFDHIIVFAPTVEEFGGTLNAEGMTEFIDAGGNLLVTGSSNTGEVLREIASECGFEVDEEGSYVIDHLNFDAARDAGHHTMVVADAANLVKSDKITGGVKAPLLFQGAGLLADTTNPLVVDVLTGSSSAYSHNPEEPVRDYPHVVGKNTVLIAALQARNNARVVFSGSLEFFSDEFFNAEVVGKDGKTVKVGNQAFAKAVTMWCFQETGVLRVDSINHHLAGESETPKFYTIYETVEFEVKIQEKTNGVWAPYDGKDVQVEFVRIDPFVRATMMNSGDRIWTQFKVPDVYGVYQFRINHQRLGLTRIQTVTQVSVHPLRHTQYERFISSAYPYYASSFSMMFGVFVFAIVFLHYKEEDTAKKTQ